MPEDYLLRFIEESLRMRWAIQAERKAGRNSEASAEVEKACLSRIGLPMNVIRHSSPENLLDLLERSGDPNNSSLLLADLLMEDAELMKEARNIPDMVRSQVQALCLLGEKSDFLPPDEAKVYRSKLEALAKELAPFAQTFICRASWKSTDFRRF